MTQLDNSLLAPRKHSDQGWLTHVVTLSMPSSLHYPWVAPVSPLPLTLLSLSQVLQAGAAVQTHPPSLSDHMAYFTLRRAVWKHFLYLAQESTYFSSPLNPLSLCIPVVIISKSGPDFFPQYETVYFPLSSPVFSPVLSADQRTSSLAYELFSRMEEKFTKPLHLSQPILATAIRNHTFYEPLLFFQMRFTGDLARKSACMNVLCI